MKHIFRFGVVTLVLPLALAACQRQVQVATPGNAATAAPQPVVVATAGPSVPAQTTLELRLNNELSTASSRVGDRFTATLLTPVLNAERQTVIPTGATVRGTVTFLRPSTDVLVPAMIQLDFQNIEWGSRSAPFRAEIVSTQAETRGGGVTETLRGAAAGAAAGAALGAVIGRDVQGALTGAAIGAGAGSVISLGVSDQEGVLRTGTQMTVRLTDPVPLNR
ncbi:MAG: YMGG-like glycine zipper-containing protein [Gemmatimonadota bacterium]|jgi:hypothetical protein|nr:YMGG-like glycine zipper-containing protein [Gemmatimonadota bacterium]